MAILTQGIAEVSGGFSKKIDVGAFNMMYDLVQKYQYQYPIKSSIREVVSNALDSIKEKHVAISILKGESKVSDHYLELEGDLYKDSQFDPAYYDLKFLSTTQNDVEIIYQDGGPTEKDMIIIRDYGVGLGGNRLAGYFDLGFSTKRLNKFLLGKYGLGAKSPLATNVAYYTAISRHNGLEFTFNIYDHDVISLTPKFDMDNYRENIEVVLREGTPDEYRCYAKATGHPNMVEIQVPVKKHHKQQYIDAVTSQLLYFSNVSFRIVYPDGRQEPVKVHADVLYEDDLVIISSNTQYSKPHLLLNGMNYGYIDFRELELEEKMGNIGIKVDPDKVSINPSRESLIWDDQTRNLIIQKFGEVQELASQLINKELDTPDFITWIHQASTVSGSYWADSNHSVLSRLAKLVDLSGSKLKFSGNPKLKFGELFDDMPLQIITMEEVREGSKKVKKVSYDFASTSGLSKGYPLYILRASHFSNRTNKYLLSKHPEGFLAIKLHVYHEDGSPVTDRDVSLSVAESVKLKNAARCADVINAILASPSAIWYEDVEVPENFKGTDKEEEEEILEEQSEEALLSMEERRKLEGKIVVNTLRLKYIGYRDPKAYISHKLEVPVQSIDRWENEEVFWSNKDYETLLSTAAFITRPGHNLDVDKNYRSSSDIQQEVAQLRREGYSTGDLNEYGWLPWYWQKSPVRLIRVAQENVKYFQDFQHITKFFKQIRKGTITMSNALIRWNTARLLHERIDELAFLNGFKQIDEARYAKYRKCKTYVTSWYREFPFRMMGAEEEIKDSVISHCNKVGTLQLFVRAHPEDTEQIAQMARDMFNPEPGVNITDGAAIDLKLYDMYMELLDWAEPVHVLLNEIELLTEGETLTQHIEMEIRNYLRYRGVEL